MGRTGRVVCYIGLGVLLLVLFDPRTWGQSLDTGSGDEIGVVFAADLLVGALAAAVVLTVVVVVVELLVRRRTRNTDSAPVATTRSWYDD